MKYAAVTNAVEEQAPDPDGPSCNFCHVTLCNFAQVFNSFTHTGSRDSGSKVGGAHSIPMGAVAP